MESIEFGCEGISSPNLDERGKRLTPEHEAFHHNENSLMETNDGSWPKNIVEKEAKGWEGILGKVDIDPLPEEITPEVVKKLDSYGMKLRYMPNLRLGPLEDLKNNGVKKIFREFGKRVSEVVSFRRIRRFL